MTDSVWSNASESAQRLLAGKLRFIQDPETISEVKARRRTEEFRQLKSHVSDRKLRILISAGLTLRKFSQDPDCREQLLALKDDIRRKWPIDGLHIAQVVELGLPLELLNEATKRGMSHPEVSRLITGFLLASRNFAIFVQEEANSALIAKDVSIRLATETDSVVVMFSMGRGAGTKLRRVLAELRKTKHYRFAVSGEYPRLMAIITRKDSAALEPAS